MFLDALQKKLGKAAGRAVFDDLRAADDAEAPTIGPGRFEYQLPPATAPGSAIDDGSFQPTPISGGPVTRESHAASNALLVGAKRSKTGRPILVGGPQVGYFSRSSSWRSTLTGRVRRSARCFPDCRSSSSAVAPTTPDRDVVAGRQRRHLRREPVRRRPPLSPQRQLPGDDEPRRGHPAIDRLSRPAAEPAANGAWPRAGLRDGRRDARRAIPEALHEGPEVLSGPPIRAEHRPGDVRQELRQHGCVGGGDVQLPLRPPRHRPRDGRAAADPSQGTDPSLPTVGTGEYEWRGFLGAKAHPQTVSPESGAILDWNSRPAAGWGAADDNWSAAPCSAGHLTVALGAGKQSVAEVVAASNKAATQDLRVMEVAGDRRRARHGSGAEPAGEDRSRSPDRVACGR